MLKLSETDSLIVTFCVALSNLFWLPVMGALSGPHRPPPVLLAIFSALTLSTAYPGARLAGRQPTFGNMLTVELWLSFLYGSYNGAMVVALTEIVPARRAHCGFSLAYSLATAMFGGFTPRDLDLADRSTGNKAAPGMWMAFGGLCGLGATVAIYWLVFTRTNGTGAARGDSAE